MAPAKRVGKHCTHRIAMPADLAASVDLCLPAMSHSRPSHAQRATSARSDSDALLCVCVCFSPQSAVQPGQALSVAAPGPHHAEAHQARYRVAQAQEGRGSVSWTASFNDHDATTKHARPNSRRIASGLRGRCLVTPLLITPHTLSDGTHSTHTTLSFDRSIDFCARTT